jgi:hypothetical protein
MLIKKITASVSAIVLLPAFCAGAMAFDQGPGIASANEILAQLNKRVSELSSAVNDEYGSEVLADRRVRVMDVPHYGTIALATFTIEGFSLGNNWHQFLAVFGPPNERNGNKRWPYYSLTGFSEVGDGCDANIEKAQVKFDGKSTLKIKIPNSESRFCVESELSFLMKGVGNSRLDQLCRTDPSGRCM